MAGFGFWGCRSRVGRDVIENLIFARYRILISSVSCLSISISSYRVRHGKLALLNWLWQIEICKLDCFGRGFEILRFEKVCWYNLFLSCNIYDPICKHENFVWKKRNIFNVTTVKLFPKNKSMFVGGFIIIYSMVCYLLLLENGHLNLKNSKLTKKPEIFPNWTV